MNVAKSCKFGGLDKRYLLAVSKSDLVQCIKLNTPFDAETIIPRKGGVLVPDWVLVAAAGLLAYGGYELYSQHKRAYNAEGLAFGMYSKGLEDGAEKNLCNWLQREDCPLPKELRHQLLDLLPDPDKTIAAENLKTT